MQYYLLFVVLILVHYQDIRHPNCSFDFAVWKSVALWTVIREKNRQQINGLHLYSLYCSHTFLIFVPIIIECFYEQKYIPVLGQKVQHNQALKHAGRRLEGTS